MVTEKETIKSGEMETKTKIYTIFSPSYFPKKNDLLEKLRSELDEIDFIGLDNIRGIMDTAGREKAYQNIRGIKDEIDGVVIFGGYLDHELTSLGLPIIIVRSLFGVGDWEKGILSFYKGEKVLTASLSDFDISSRLSTSRFEDLFDKIKLIVALKRAKESRLLVVQEPEILGNYDILGMDFHSPLPEDYNEVYAQELKEVGPEIVHASLNELNKEIGKTDGDKAEKVANRWINEANELRATNREEVLKATRLYLGMEKLMERHSATGIAIRSLVPWVKGMINITPCLANTELNKQLKVAVCEGLVNSAITEMFGIYITGNPSFIGDVVGIDRINDTVTFAHCQCPINPHGSDRVPYIIRSHALQKGNKMLPDDYPEAGPTLGAAVQVEPPMDETVTAVKFSIYYRKIAVSTGVSVLGEKFYRDFDNILCRTKIALKTNSEIFERKYDTATFGVHRNLIYGNHRARIKNLSTLLGFEVVEEDR